MHHGEGLRRLLKVGGYEPEAIEALVEALAHDHRGAKIGDPDRAMLDYVEKLTLTPGALESSDVEALRDQGFGDRAIHDMCAVAAYYAFVNRIADGLGVELEEGRE